MNNYQGRLVMLVRDETVIELAYAASSILVLACVIIILSQAITLNKSLCLAASFVSNNNVVNTRKQI